MREKLRPLKYELKTEGRTAGTRIFCAAGPREARYAGFFFAQ
jgi:hypothetical protein